MAVKTWSAAGAGNWSTGSNWSGGTVPVTTDDIVFDGTSVEDCTIDNVGTWSGGTFSINSGYSGLITKSVAIVCSTFSIADGTFDAGSTSMTTTGAFSISAGSFTATSGTWTHQGSMTKTGSPTFDANGGTVAFTGTATQTIDMNGLTFSLVTITRGGGANVLTIVSGTTVPLGSNPTTTMGVIGGDLVVDGTITVSGAWVMTLGELTVGSTGVVSGALTSYEFSGPFAVNAGGSFPTNVALALVGSSGVATLNAAGITFAVSTINRTGSGSVSISSGTVLPLGANPVSVAAGSSGLVVNGTVTVSGTWTHTGVLNVNAGGTVSGALTTLNISGSLTVNATATFPSSVILELVGTATQTITSTVVTFGTSTINKTSGGVTIAGSTTFPLGASPTTAQGASTLTITGTVTVSGTWTHTGAISVSSSGIVSGSLTALLLTGDFTVSSGGTFPSSVAVTVNGTGSQSVNLTGVTLGTSFISKSAGNCTISSATTFPLGASPTTTCALLTISGTVSASGTWTHTSTSAPSIGSSGIISGSGITLLLTVGLAVNASATIPADFSVTFTIDNSGSRTFGGGGKTYGTITRTGNASGTGQLTINDNNTFTTFVDNDGLAAHAITFGNGSTQTIGTFDVDGSAGNLVTLRRVSSGVFTLTSSNPQTVTFCDIINSTVDASPLWVALDSNNGGGNTNWLFGLGGPRKSAALIG